MSLNPSGTPASPVPAIPQAPSSPPTIYSSRPKVRITPEQFNPLDIECVDCGVTFTFSPGEQAYYKSKGLSIPKRCTPCRQERKERLARDGNQWPGSSALE